MMVEVKIQCACGTRYKFEVEPAQGRMPQRVSCPGCGADGTPEANAILTSKVGGTQAPAAGGRLGPGIAGAVMAAVMAMVAWFFLIRMTGHALGFAAWGVGLLVGLGARVLGRSGSRRLGWIAAACALAAILGGQWLAGSSFGDATRAGHPGLGLHWLTALWLAMAVLSAFKLADARG
jgi:hypothetical protein